MHQFHEFFFRCAFLNSLKPGILLIGIHTSNTGSHLIQGVVLGNYQFHEKKFLFIFYQFHEFFFQIGNREIITALDWTN